MAIVYVATNIINGCRYIGFTSKTLRIRKRQHILAARSRLPKMFFSRAIKEYGKEFFRFQIVRDGLSINEALQLEKTLISKLDPEYNTQSGEKNGFHTTKRIRQRKQTKRRRGPSPKKVICLDDGKIYESAASAATAYGITRINVCVACLTTRLASLGKKAPNGYRISVNDKHHFSYYNSCSSDETRLSLLSIIRKRKSKKRKSVLCAQTGKVYRSCRSAAQLCGLSEYEVAASCKNESNTKSGLKFSYVSSDC